jgi:uncharacterized membrane protein (DUF2068 family)
VRRPRRSHFFGVEQRRDTLIVLIGVFKLVKGAALMALGVAICVTVPAHLAIGAERLADWLGIFTGRPFVDREIARLFQLDPTRARVLAIFALIYSTVFFIEGAGLLARRRWAEWMTVIVTASFIPFEIFGLVHRFGPGKVATLVLNVAIVGYLAARRLRERGGLRRFFRRRPHLFLVGEGPRPVVRRQRAIHP